MTGSREAVLIDAAELGQRLGAEGLVVLDVRWALSGPPGRALYAEGHVPGAVYVDMETELADRPTNEAGRHPLPSFDAFEASARRWGIRDNSSVVVYDDSGGLAAARAWWLLRWGGLRDVRLLDGGLGSWRRAGGTLETEEPEIPPGDVTLSPGHMPVLDAEGAARVAENGVLLDARSGERYRGDVEPIDPVAGHIPGAVSAPSTDNLAPDTTFADTDDLVDRFRALGVDGIAPVGAYCGSGVTAAHEVAALAVAGFDNAALYVGSWSQWLSDPTRPVATSQRKGRSDV